MVLAKIIIRILSDMIIVFSAAGLIDSFGISRFRSLKYKLAAVAASLVPAIIFSETRGALLVIGYTLMFVVAFIILFFGNKVVLCLHCAGVGVRYFHFIIMFVYIYQWNGIISLF